jgi:hypothetical protein
MGRPKTFLPDERTAQDMLRCVRDLANLGLFVSCYDGRTFNKELILDQIRFAQALVKRIESR